MAPKRTSVSGPGNSDADRVRVVVRIRPPVRKDEKFGEGSEALQYDAEKNLLFLLAKEDDKEKNTDPKQFVFDKVLWKDSQQVDAWESAGLPIVNAVLEGYTGCVMCYGQTGAGKSFTLANESKGQEGVMIAAFHHIFARASESRDLKYDVAISYQQIYLDTITDLLNPTSDVEIREDPKQGVYVAGATWSNVDSAAAAMKVLQKGNSNRATACTKMNSASSRSHAALIVRVTTTGGTRTLNGMLYLVDLAGSERVKKSGVEGAAFDEAKAINQSLTTLGRCIEVLASNKKEKPPFRESKLTRLLSNAIGGGAKTTLVICCAPTMTDQFETVGSLDFGQQAMNVVVRAKVNASTDYGSLTASLLQQRDKKSKSIRELEAQVLRGLAPELDQVLSLEAEYRAASLALDLVQDRVNERAQECKELERAFRADEDKAKESMSSLLSVRSEAAKELEQVLMSLSSDPEIKSAQEKHEAEKNEIAARASTLTEELRSIDLAESNGSCDFEERLEGVCSTARNLGQMAAYFLQRNQNEEAAEFYVLAKSIFDKLLGAEHPKTLSWQEDLFFLINAPAIQSMVKQAQSELQTPANVSPKNEVAMRNILELGSLTRRSSDKDSDGDDMNDNWWMNNLFAMDSVAEGNDPNKISDEDGADFMQVLFGTPRENGETTPRGGPAFTPRGTLVALSEVNGNKGAAISLGKPLQKQSGIPEDQQVDDATVNMDFAKDWIQKIFETPRGENGQVRTIGSEDIEAGKTDAFRWLQENFGKKMQDEENQPPVLH